VDFTGQDRRQLDRASTLAGTAWIVAWNAPSAGGGSSSVVMIERCRNSGGVLRAAAKPFDPTGSARVPSQAGAAVASPIQGAVGLGAEDGDAAELAGTAAGALFEQPASRPAASKNATDRRIRTGPVCRGRPTGGYRGGDVDGAIRAAALTIIVHLQRTALMAAPTWFGTPVQPAGSNGFAAARLPRLQQCPPAHDPAGQTGHARVRPHRPEAGGDHH